MKREDGPVQKSNSHTCSQRQDKKGERIPHIVARAEQYAIIIPEMQSGAIIAIATLTHCLKINEIQIYYLAKDKSKELAFGDFTEGCYAWILSKIQQSSQW